jgi:hypothetical protein
MRAYRRLQVLLVAIFAGYLVLAAAEVASGEKGAAFPVYSWALFEKVPDRITLYAARVRWLDGRGLVPARNLPDLQALVPGAASLRTRDAVWRLGQAIAAGDVKGAAAARRVLERLSLGRRPLRYEIVERTYDDPVAAWRGARPLGSRTLGVFTTDGTGG